MNEILHEIEELEKAREDLVNQDPRRIKLLEEEIRSLSQQMQYLMPPMDL